MIQNFSATLTALSAMITPAVLILASGQLILTTSQRLARAMDRMRKLSDTLDDLRKDKPDDYETRRGFILMLLKRSASRARRLQMSMSILYIALSIFVFTSVTIGIFDIFNLPQVWFPLALGMFGVLLMFVATIFLITETNVAMGSVSREVDYLVEHT